jgi:hypothetical protein
MSKVKKHLKSFVDQELTMNDKQLFHGIYHVNVQVNENSNKKLFSQF